MHPFTRYFPIIILPELFWEAMFYHFLVEDVCFAPYVEVLIEMQIGEKRTLTTLFPKEQSCSQNNPSHYFPHHFEDIADQRYGRTRKYK